MISPIDQMRIDEQKAEAKATAERLQREELARSIVIEDQPAAWELDWPT